MNLLFSPLNSIFFPLFSSIFKIPLFFFSYCNFVVLVFGAIWELNILWSCKIPLFLTTFSFNSEMLVAHHSFQTSLASMSGGFLLAYIFLQFGYVNIFKFGTRYDCYFCSSIKPFSPSYEKINFIWIPGNSILILLGV